jgi:hypothetical protein
VPAGVTLESNLQAATSSGAAEVGQQDAPGGDRKPEEENPMNKKNLLVSAALSGMFLAATVATTAIAAEGTAGAAVQGECHGMNSCKGTGECGGKGHACHGKNECKGQGWVKKSKAECEEAGGEFKD